MSVDNSLERIATALEKIATVAGGAPVRADLSPEAILEVQKLGLSPTVAAAVAEAVATPAKRGRPAKPVADVQPTVAPVTPDPIIAAVVAKVAPSFLDDEPVAPIVRPAATRDNVRSALVAVQKATSPDEAFALLKDSSGGAETIGAKTAQVPKGLTEDKFDAVIAAAVKKIGGAAQTVALVTEVPLKTSLAAYLGVAA